MHYAPIIKCDNISTPQQIFDASANKKLTRSNGLLRKNKTRLSAVLCYPLIPKDVTVLSPHFR